MSQQPASPLSVRTACPLAGVDLLLVHGMTSSSRYWGENLGPLAGHFRVAAPDLLGFGRSPKPEDGRYDPEQHAAALAAVIEQAGAPAVVVGHSLGALLALHLATRYPTLVRGVALVSLPFFANEAEARRQLARGSAMARLQIERPRLARLFCWAVCHARPLMRALMPLLERDVEPEIARAAVDHVWQSASGTVNGVILGTRPADLLAGIAARRLLFIHAADDRTAPPRRVVAYAQAHPEAELLVLADGGHHPYPRHPAACSQAIAAFVRRLPAGGLDAAGEAPR